MHVSDPWVQLAPACSLISQRDPCCCADTLTQRNQCNSLKCLSVSAGDQCVLWRKRQRGGRRRGPGERTQDPEWMTERWGVRRKRRRRDAVWDERWGRWHYTRSDWWMFAYREIVSLEATWPLTQPIRLYVKTTTSTFVLKLRERSWGRDVCVKEKRLVPTITTERYYQQADLPQAPPFLLLTYIPFKISLFSYKRKLFLQAAKTWKHNKTIQDIKSAGTILTIQNTIKGFILNIDVTVEEVPNESQIDWRLFWLIQGFYSIWQAYGGEVYCSILYL